jgi:hypothetical protein
VVSTLWPSGPTGDEGITVFGCGNALLPVLEFLLLRLSFDVVSDDLGGALFEPIGLVMMASLAQ